jgi:hypothetical protein
MGEAKQLSADRCRGVTGRSPARSNAAVKPEIRLFLGGSHEPIILGKLPPNFYLRVSAGGFAFMIGTHIHHHIHTEYFSSEPG